VAVVVSKKVSKSAVVRNRIRRRVIENIRLLEDQISQPYDLVVTIFDEKVATMPAEELTDVLKNLLRQAGVVS
jgi:ribonuclease P protein component